MSGARELEKGSKREIDRLRSRARRDGVAIRTERGSTASPSGTYSLIDRETGTVIRADVQGLASVQTWLKWIALSRKESASPPPMPEARVVRCPACGTTRIGHFRWCRSCGLDYEAWKESSPAEPLEATEVELAAVEGTAIEETSVEETAVEMTAVDEPAAEVVSLAVPDPAPEFEPLQPPEPEPWKPMAHRLERPAPPRDPITARMGRLADAVREAYRFGRWRQLVAVAIVALIAGALVPFLLGMMR